MVATVRLIFMPPRYDEASIAEAEKKFSECAEALFGDMRPDRAQRVRSAKRRWARVFGASVAWAAGHYVWYAAVPSAYRSFWSPIQGWIERMTSPAAAVGLFIALPVLVAWQVLVFVEWEEFVRGKDYGDKWPNPPW